MSDLVLKEGNVEAQTAVDDQGAVLQPDFSAVLDLPMQIRVVLGSTKISVSQLMSLKSGDTIKLDRRVGDMVDIFVGERPFARGEIVVINEDPVRFGVAILELVSSSQKRRVSKSAP
jgi:flagellar motor switch protein FliN